MGMFDDIRVEYPLPDPDAQHLGFQTKDLGCELDQYTITRDGRLLLDRWTMRELPFDPKKPIFQQNLWERIPGSLRQEDQEYHGDLNIYASRDPETGATFFGSYPPGRERPLPVWYEYIVRFTHGRVEKITRVSPREDPPHES